MKPDPYLIPLTKITSKRFKDLNIKPETMRLPEENIGIKILDMGFGNDFFGHDTESIRSKIINEQLGLQQTEKLLQIKRHQQQSKKTNYGTGKNICKPYI